jgi:ABC-type uncharacterized transport system substrate-binding protein
MAYGANVPDNFRRAASYVDRILKGASPADLPIQEPVRFDFVINQDRERARPHDPASDPRPRRRGHRMKQVCAALAVWFCAAVQALAQDRAPLPLVGLLRIDTPATLGLTSRLLREALAALGYVDGSNIRLDFRLAEGDAGRFPEMAAALVRDKPSVIVAQGEAAARAAQAATRTIPILASTKSARAAWPSAD